MNILFVNHKQKQCGVYQYGRRVFDIINKSLKYRFQYEEIESAKELYMAEVKHAPMAVIYNYHNLTMPWLGRGSLNPITKHYCIHHEGSKPTHAGFDYYLHVDSTFRERGNEFALPRPLFEESITKSVNPITVVSSFGFGFGHKGFGSVVKLANEQFKEVILRLHIPRAYYGDRSGEATAGVIPGCQAEMKNPLAKLEITHDFKDDMELLGFLSQSDINVFLYHETHNTGLSSVMDYALSVPVPIAVNTTSMFRHIASPDICVENKTLPEIISQGQGTLDIFRDKWSHKNLIFKYESILDSTL